MINNRTFHELWNRLNAIKAYLEISAKMRRLKLVLFVSQLISPPSLIAVSSWSKGHDCFARNINEKYALSTMLLPWLQRYGLHALIKLDNVACLLV